MSMMEPSNIRTPEEQPWPEVAPRGRSHAGATSEGRTWLGHPPCPPPGSFHMTLP